MIKVNENSFVNKCREWTSSISETLWNTMTSVFNSLSPISNTCFKYIGGMYYSIKDKMYEYKQV